MNTAAVKNGGREKIITVSKLRQAKHRSHHEPWSYFWLRRSACRSLENFAELTSKVHWQPAKRQRTTFGRVEPQQSGAETVETRTEPSTFQLPVKPLRHPYDACMKVKFNTGGTFGAPLAPTSCDGWGTRKPASTLRLRVGPPQQQLTSRGVLPRPQGIGHHSINRLRSEREVQATKYKK